MISKFTVKEEKELLDIAEKILNQNKNVKIFALIGDLGAGKTALVKAFMSNLGSTDMVSSPTFSLVNEYSLPTGKAFHFDLYRLESVEEVLDMGFEEYIDSGSYCFIEWPEKITDLLPKMSTNIINIEVLNNQYRQLNLAGH